MQLCIVVILFLQSYGWFVVLGLAVAFYFKGYIEQAFSRWRSSRQQETDYHRYGTVSHFHVWSISVLIFFYVTYILFFGPRIRSPYRYCNLYICFPLACSIWDCSYEKSSGHWSTNKHFHLPLRGR